MKLNHYFEIIHTEDHYTAVPIGNNAYKFNAVLEMNDITARMLKCIQNSKTVEEAQLKCNHEFSKEDPTEIKENLTGLLNQLMDEGILSL